MTQRLSRHRSRTLRTARKNRVAARSLAVLFVSFVIIAASAAHAYEPIYDPTYYGPAPQEDPGLLREGGMGAASAAASLVYGPLKLGYAVGGLVLGGSTLLWTWGDQETAMTLVHMSLGGDYVITPAHLGGADDIRFTGELPARQ